MDGLEGKTAFLIGGGIGIPPMLELAKELSCQVQAVLGYRDNSLFLKKEFENYGSVYVATEDGSAGTKGNVPVSYTHLDVYKRQLLHRL